MATEPMCALAHELLNKLTTVIAECEMLLLEDHGCPGAHRVQVIKEMSVEMAAHLSRHQCQITELLRALPVSPAPPGE
ncbi:MAG: hypothetical protein WBW84_13840 [Acidobacteriaceae bacterium]